MKVGLGKGVGVGGRLGGQVLALQAEQHAALWAAGAVHLLVAHLLLPSPSLPLGLRLGAGAVGVGWR